VIQSAWNDLGLAANTGKATNRSDGKATISTGDASAVGNVAESHVLQSATGSAGGDPGGLVVITQAPVVTNVGVGVANTGANLAIGNVSGSGRSPNLARLTQTIGTEAAPDAMGLASNNGEATNWSDGSAAIGTGDAWAVGNDALTKVAVDATADLDGADGGALITQAPMVVSFGLAAANSGLNASVGNAATETRADGSQEVGATGGDDLSVVGQFGSIGNSSDGSASVRTGDASARGNQSTTDVWQTDVAKGGALNVISPVLAVQNAGIGVANSGLNVAVGNASTETTTDPVQGATPPADDTLGLGVIGQFELGTNSTAGTADISTGNATVVGNHSTTVVGQAIDPTGLLVPTQVANVTNAGLGVANSGANVAIGNAASSYALWQQFANIGAETDPAAVVVAGSLVISNNLQASNASDGTARIHTGDASATGNDSSTTISQQNDASTTGLGFVLNTQAAVVGNVGLGVANSGLNVAVGNDSNSSADLFQTSEIGSFNTTAPGDTTIVAGILTQSNNGTAHNGSDGTAEIATGDATGTGNRSATRVSQVADGDVSGFGGSINTQVAAVANAGIGVGNSGLNVAEGNTSSNVAGLVQDITVGSESAFGQVGPDHVSVTAGLLTTANDGTTGSSSDGSATIRTGDAEGTGNASSTNIDQETNGDVSGLGLVLDTQVAAVANLGLGIGNSGANVAVGNDSANEAGTAGDGGNPNVQRVDIGSGLVGPNGGAGIDVDLLTGLLTASNSAQSSNSSDGTATIDTGDAQGQGNVSSTNVRQDPNSNVDGLGVVVGTQAASVVNAGAGIANSGLNAAVGNASGQVDGPNHVGFDQSAEVGSGLVSGVVGDVDLTAASLLGSNTANASNSSDGTARVGTGGALATGNASATDVEQRESGTVSEMGTVIGTQVGGVANVGIGVANSGLNVAVGNASTNTADLEQNAWLLSGPDEPTSPLTVIGTAGAVDSGEVSNTSDGEACVCTGDAIGSGNVSSTTLVQDLDLDTDEGGLVLMTEAGGVLNAGLGIGNSGANLAIGNASTNTAVTSQDSINDDVLPDGAIVGDQINSNGGGARNTSNGTGKVGTGNADGTGNQSSTNLAQAAAASGPLSLANIVGGTSNVGAGLANAGLNLGIGNLSVNEATLDQDARGAGIVSNQGEATNDSDGTAIVGNPDCDVPGQPTSTPGAPGAPGLPRTGGPIEVEAAIGLMLLLVGMSLRRTAHRRG
jgi:hypothetical protein